MYRRIIIILLVGTCLSAQEPDGNSNLKKVTKKQETSVSLQEQMQKKTHKTTLEIELEKAVKENRITEVRKIAKELYSPQNNRRKYLLYFLSFVLGVLAKEKLVWCKDMAWYCRDMSREV